MIIIIYILIFLILVFVSFIGFKAIGSGIEAKKRNKYNKQIKGSRKNISKELSVLNNLYKTGAINKKEFNKAKKKILSN